MVCISIPDTHTQTHTHTHRFTFIYKASWGYPVLPGSLYLNNKLYFEGKGGNVGELQSTTSFVKYTLPENNKVYCEGKGG